MLAAYPIELDRTPTILTGADLRVVRARSDLAWVQPPLDDAVVDTARNATLALASESFCERFRKKRGDTVRVPTPAGPQTLTLAGVYADYGNERGSLLVERARLVAWFGDDYAANVSLFLRPGTDAESLRTALLARHPGLAIYTNAALRTEILRIFRQTFSITYALEVIGVAVAVIGLALTLSSVLLDRREELTTLRALGFADDTGPHPQLANRRLDRLRRRQLVTDTDPPADQIELQGPHPGQRRQYGPQIVLLSRAVELLDPVGDHPDTR